MHVLVCFSFTDFGSLFCAPSEYTYAEVEARSNQVANFLLEKGIARGDIVAIFAHRSTPIVYAILGILKAGATFTVIDPAYPPERQIVYLRVALPKALITISKAGPLHADVVKVRPGRRRQERGKERGNGQRALCLTGLVATGG